MNWTLALPEIVLSVCAMAILMFGVFRKAGSEFPCTMLSLGALLIAAMLVISTDFGSGYNGLFVVDRLSEFSKILVLLAGAITLMLALDYNRAERIGRFEFPVLVLFSVTGM